MKMIKGRILWNVYAWTITILLLLNYAMTWHESTVLTMLNFLLIMSALIVLHLNTWDKWGRNSDIPKSVCIHLYIIILYSVSSVQEQATATKFRDVSWLADIVAIVHCSLHFCISRLGKHKKPTKSRKKIKNNY